jgi:hypothetical protein
MKLRCDIIVVIAMSVKETADRDIRNSETGRIVCRDGEKKRERKFITCK